MSCAVLLMQFAITVGDRMPTVQEIEERFVKYRGSLVPGWVSLRGEWEMRRPRSMNASWRSKIWYTNKSYRCDKWAESGEPLTREVYCEHCERPDHYVYFDAANLKPNARSSPLLLQSMNLPPGASRQGAGLKFDPRILGISTTSYAHFHATQLGSLIGRTDRSKPAIQRVPWKDGDAVLISYSLNKSGTIIQNTHVPEMADCIVRSELRAVYGEGKLKVHAVMEVEPAQFGPNGTWFPKRIEMREFGNGELSERYLIEITDAEFGKPIPGEVFTLAGMEIPAGTPIRWLKDYDQGRHLWDGQSMVRATGKDAVVFHDEPPLSERANWSGAAFVVSLGAAIGAVVAFALYFWRRNRVGTSRSST